MPPDRRSIRSPFSESLSLPIEARRACSPDEGPQSSTKAQKHERFNNVRVFVFSWPRRMTTATSCVAGALLVFTTFTPRPAADDCSALGDVQFVCGQAGPEDLAVVPGDQWVIAGGDTGEDGALRLV